MKRLICTTALGLMFASGAIAQTSRVPLVIGPKGTNIELPTTDKLQVKNLTANQLICTDASKDLVTSGCPPALATNGSNGQGLTSNGVGGFGTPITFGYYATGASAANLTGTAPNSIIPVPTLSALGGVEALASATTHDFITYIDVFGIQHLARPACADLSDSGVFCSATDAANLTGTVSVNRFNSGTGASSSTFLRGDGTWVSPGGGVTSFDTRIGAVVLLSSDVVSALGYTPAVQTNGINGQGLTSNGAGGFGTPITFGTFATQNYATPPAIGGTTPSALHATTTTATTGVDITGVDATVCPAVGVSLLCLDGASFSGYESGIGDQTVVTGSGYNSLYLNPTTPTISGGILTIYVNPTNSAVGTINGDWGIYVDPYQNTVGAIQTFVEGVVVDADIDNGTYITENLFHAQLVSGGGLIVTLNDFLDDIDYGATPVTTHHGFWQPATNHPNEFASTIMLPSLSASSLICTDASKIISSTCILPNPSATTLGGVESITSLSHNWISYIDTLGVPHQSQPAFTDISGVASGAQLPNPSASTLGGVESLAATTHDFLTSISTSGIPTQARPVCADLSDSASGCSTAAYVLPNPSASTLGGIESIVAVSHNFITSISTVGVPTQAQPVCADLSDSASGCSTAAYVLPNPSASILGGVKSLLAVSHNFLTSISTAGLPVAAQPACADLSDSASGCNTASPTGANPSATVGTSAVNGSSSNFMRADGAPAINLTMAPTMSGAWIFSATGASSVPAIKISGTPFAGTGTTSFPQFLVQDSAATASTTWSTSGTSLGVNAHTGVGNLLDLQFDGASRFKIDPSGNVTFAGGATLLSGGVNVDFIGSSGVFVGSNKTIGFSSITNAQSTIDVILSRHGAANIQLGALDAASPVAQTLSVQSVVAGTSNTAGAAETINASASTGSGLGGKISFQTSLKTAAATVQNSFQAVEVLDGNQHVSFLNSGAPTVSTCGTSPTIDSHASDTSGTVTVGTVAAASCTITFKIAYASWDHCSVTSQGLVTSLAYSYTLSAITVTGTSLVGDLLDYRCDGA